MTTIRAADTTRRRTTTFKLRDGTPVPRWTSDDMTWRQAVGLDPQ